MSDRLTGDVLAALRETVEAKTSLSRADVSRVLARHAETFGAYQLLLMMLHVGSGSAGVFDQTFRLAFDKASFLAPALEDIEGPVLSVGAGAGQVEAQLATRGLQVTGIDTGEAAVERARRLAARVRGAEDTRFLHLVGDRFPFPPASFRTVMYVSVLHELADPGTSLAEAARVLAPGGILIVGEDGAAWGRTDLASAVAGAGFRQLEETLLPQVLDHGAISHYTVRRFQR